MVMTWMNSTRPAKAPIQRVAKPRIGSSASVARLKSSRRIRTILGQQVLSYFKNLLVTINICVRREESFGKTAGVMPHLTSLVGVFKHPTNLLCENRFVSGRYEEARNVI